MAQFSLSLQVREFKVAISLTHLFLVILPPSTLHWQIHKLIFTLISTISGKYLVRILLTEKFKTRQILQNYTGQAPLQN